MTANWLIPLQGRNSSGAFNLNFLWQQGNIYIMDNHRAALWCWFQHFSQDTKVSLFHIDQHSDTLNSNIDRWVHLCPDLWEIGIEQYLSLFDDDNDLGTKPLLFRWDNYLSIFLKKYRDSLNKFYFMTQGKGDEPQFENIETPKLWRLTNNFDCWIEENENWILNIDIDYFFYKSGFEQYSLLFSDEYIQQLFENVSQMLNDGKIAVLTIALSPDCCGGWESAESICYKICDILELSFKIPASS